MKCLLTLLATGVLAGCAAPLERHEYVELVMASPARIVLYATDEDSARRAARATYDRLHELDRTLSDWNPDSELRRLVAAAPHARTTSATLRDSIVRALDHAQATDGAFDPTLGPLVILWREARTARRLPDPAAIAEARELVDIDAIEIEADTIRVTRPGVMIDLGAIGKGIALDEASRLLEAEGFDHHLIDLDGEIRAGQAPPGRNAWSITVEAYGTTDRPPLTLALVDASVSTSGDSHQFIELDGRRYSHVLDPETGLGLVDPIQVTVIAGSGETSDALATAGCVLGADRLREVMERHYPEAAAVVSTIIEGRPTITRIGRIPVPADDGP